MPIPWYDPRTYDIAQGFESGPRRGDYFYGRTGSNRGPFQFGPQEWKDYGRGGDINSYADARAAAEREYAKNATAYQKQFGKEMTGDIGYLYHQQGPAGAPALLNNPNSLAWQAIRPFYKDDATAQSAIWGNVPSDRRAGYNPATMTAQQFTDLWRDKFVSKLGGAPLSPAPRITDLNDPRYQTPLSVPQIMAMTRAQLPGYNDRSGLGAGGYPADRSASALMPTAGGLVDVNDILGGPQQPPPSAPPGPFRQLIAPLLRPRPMTVSTPPPMPPIAEPGMPSPEDVGGGLEVGPPTPQDFPAEATDIVPEPPAGPRDYERDPSSYDPRFGSLNNPGAVLPQFGFAERPPTAADLGINYGGLGGFGPGALGAPGGFGDITGGPVPPTTGVSVADVAGREPQNVPIPKEILERRGPGRPELPEDLSLAGRWLGKENAAGLRGIISGMYPGLSVLLDRPYLADIGFKERGANRADLLAGAQLADAAQRQKLYGRENIEMARRDAAYNNLFPNGVADANHPAFKDLTETARNVLPMLGPDGAIKFLGEYQLKDAEARAAMNRNLEQLGGILKQFGGGGTVSPTTTPTPPPIAAPTGPPAPQQFGGAGIGQGVAGVAPPSPPVAPPMPAARGTLPMGGGGAPSALPPTSVMANAMGNAMPQLPPMGTAAAPAPAVAPAVAPQPAVAAPPAGAEPMVRTLAGWLPISKAEQLAQALELYKYPTGELRQAITRAAEAQQAGAKEKTLLDVRQEQAKPQARAATSQLLDRIESMQALATKIHDSKYLENTVGENVDPANDPRAFRLGIWGTGFAPASLWRAKGVGSGERGVEADIRSLTKAVGLNALQALRESSKTGSSGLGSTSEGEISLLENSLTSLDDLTIPFRQYQQNLQTVLTVSKRIEDRIKSAWQETYGEPYREASGRPQFGGYPTEAPEGISKGEMERRAERRATQRAAATGRVDIMPVRNARDAANDKMRNGGWSAVEIE